MQLDDPLTPPPDTAPEEDQRFEVILRFNDGAVYPALMTMEQYKEFIAPWKPTSLITMEQDDGVCIDYPYHALVKVVRTPMKLVKLRVPIEPVETEKPAEPPPAPKSKRRQAKTKAKPAKQVDLGRPDDDPLP